MARCSSDAWAAIRARRRTLSAPRLIRRSTRFFVGVDDHHERTSAPSRSDEQDVLDHHRILRRRAYLLVMPTHHRMPMLLRSGLSSSMNALPPARDGSVPFEWDAVTNARPARQSSGAGPTTSRDHVTVDDDAAALPNAADTVDLPAPICRSDRCASGQAPIRRFRELSRSAANWASLASEPPVDCSSVRGAPAGRWASAAGLAAANFSICAVSCACARPRRSGPLLSR
jgi:hypothetical protein